MGKIDPAAYDEWYQTPFGAFCHRLERDALFSLAGFRPGERVLDAGCGTGVYLHELNDKGLSLYGLDSDLDMLHRAKDKIGLSHARLVQGSLERIPFKVNIFDKVLTVCALEFAGDAGMALYEMARVLRPGGELLLGFLNSKSRWAHVRKEKAKDPASVWHSARFYTLEELASLAVNAGLKFKSHKGAVYFPPDYRDRDIAGLEAAEAAGRSSRTVKAAFVCASFVKPRP